MTLLLDTHILIWFAAVQAKLSTRERTALFDASQLLASSISIWEIRAKVRAERRRGKRMLALDPAMVLSFCETMDIKVETVSIADMVSPLLEVDPEHGDMFDEMLLIHAQRLGAKLLTRDRRLLGHPLSVF